MQQVILTGPGVLTHRDVTASPASEGEATVAIGRIGLCGSDFHAFAGRHPAYVYPRVLGHELSGIVLSIGHNERGIVPGDHCAIDPYVNCGVCRMCRADRTNCCENLEVLGVHKDGGMQEILSVPQRLLHRSETLSLDLLALVETLGIGAHAVERAQVTSGQSALVIGAGPIGLGAAIFAREAGAEVTVVEVSEVRRAFAESQGWKTTPPDANLVANIVFDATGSTTAMAASVRHVAPGGKLVFVGLTSEAVPLDDALFHKREMTLLASRNSVAQFPRIVQLLESRHIVVDDWITERLTLRDLPRDFSRLMHRPDLVKAVVEVSDGSPSKGDTPRT